MHQQFLGWTGSNGTTAQKSVSIDKGTTGNKSYTANWTPINYTITYNLDERYVQKKDDPYLETREKEDAFVERIVSQVTEKILTNLPTLAGMYMMQQQAMLTAGLQNAGMPVMNFTADPTNANMMEAGAQKVTKSIKSGMAENQAATKKSEDILDEEPEDNEFPDFSFGM